MGKVIPISKKHGVNPSITVCLYCGKEKGIALMGKLRGDKEAPREVVIDYMPCEECFEKWKLGVPVLEVSTKPIVPNQKPISKDEHGNDVYPTGGIMVLNEEVLNGDFELGEPVLCISEDFQKIWADAVGSKGDDGSVAKDFN